MRKKKVQQWQRFTRSWPKFGWIEWAIGAVLLLGTFLLYWPTLNHGFISYDDYDYVCRNNHVRTGLHWSNVAWAFRTFASSNWHPLTWISHMLDCQWHGLNGGGHHLTNVLLHAANAALLFWVLRRMTGDNWPAAFVAAIFAWHPLRVESVVWIAERKDVLSTLFWLLTMLAYVRYAEKPGWGRYLAVALCFGLGLLCKPMLVTLPFVLLLLDFWPLRRFSLEPGDVIGAARLLREKIPLFVVAGIACIVTYTAQKIGGAVDVVAYFPFPGRLENAVVSYGRYLAKFFVPANLALPYPHSGGWPAGMVACAALLLVAVSWFVYLRGLRRPYWLVGWLWFLGTLVPVIGLVQVGVQAMADRYMYIPSIGLLIMLAWGVAGFLESRSWHVWAWGGAAATAAACLLLTINQLHYWKSSETLFRHTLAVTSRNSSAHALLAFSLSEAGKVDEAIEEYRAALRIDPGAYDFHAALGIELLMKGTLDEAETELEAGLRSDPTQPGQRQQLSPQDADTLSSLGLLLKMKGKPEVARGYYRESLRLNPENTAALNNLAWLLAASAKPELRDGPEAVRLATLACELTEYQDPVFISTLAAAYAEAGRFADAVKTGRQARELSLALGQAELAEKNRLLLQFYQSNRAYHESPGGS